MKTKVLQSDIINVCGKVDSAGRLITILPSEIVIGKKSLIEYMIIGIVPLSSGKGWGWGVLYAPTDNSTDFDMFCRSVEDFTANYDLLGKKEIYH